MKNTFAVYLTLIFIGCVEFISSVHLLKNKMVSAMPESNTSKNVYKVDPGIYTENDSNPSYYGTKTRASESPPTQIDCNVSNPDDSITHRKKRFIYYINDYSTITEASDMSVLSDKFLNCSHTYVEPGCYQILPNGSVYVPLYKRIFNKANHYIRDGLLFVCPDFFDQMEDKYSPSIGIISIVGVSISSICIILHMIMFSLVEKLRNLPGYCLLSLCISLLISYVMFFVQIKASNERANCKLIGMFMMYSLHASFFWMNVIAFDVWHAIRLATSKLRLATDQATRIRFILYSSYAWGMPLLICVIAVIVDSVTEFVGYQLMFHSATCWFQHKTALLLYFALPVFILIMMNVVFFILSFLMILRSRSDSGSQDAYSLKSRLYLSLRLGSAMGLMWILGIVANLTEQQWIDYLHAFCTALQGVFIFFSFTFNKRTQKACKNAMRSKKISELTVLTQQKNLKASD